MIQVIGFDHIVLRVRDLEQALRFYRDILHLPISFLEEYRAGHRLFVSARVGEQLVDLVPDPTYDPREGLEKGGLSHFCLQVHPGELANIISWLKKQGVNVLEEQPSLRVGARGIGLSVYITDPDGYVVELKEHAS